MFKAEISEAFGDSYSYRNILALLIMCDAVCHNRFLLNFRDYKEVNDEGNKSGSFIANVKNLLIFLPQPLKEAFKQEINSARRNGERKRNNQVKWDLMPSIIIQI